MERNNFELQWQRRQQAMQNAEANAPDDETILRMAKLAQVQVGKKSEVLVPIFHKLRWIPYVAAASILIGVTIVGWQRTELEPQLPVAEEVKVENQTIRFLCNSGCSADDVYHSAQKIIIE